MTQQAFKTEFSTIKIDGTEYNCPTEWEQLTLQQYIDIMSIPTGFSATNKLIKIFEYTAGIPVEVTRKLNYVQLKKLNTALDWMNQSYQPMPINEFEFNGEKYTAEPVSESVFGAYIDYDTFIEKFGVIQGLPYILAVLSRKQGESYDDYDTYKRAEEFKQLPVTIALDLSAFFLTNIQLTKIHTVAISSLKEEIQNQIDYTNNLLNSLDGKGSYLKRLQIKMLQKLMKFYVNRQPL